MDHPRRGAEPNHLDQAGGGAGVGFPLLIPNPRSPTLKPERPPQQTNTSPSDDVNELLSLVKQLEGFPTNSEKDIYGLDTRLVLTTFEIQWDNGGEVEGEGLTEETKETFKDVVGSVEALARGKAK